MYLSKHSAKELGNCKLMLALLLFLCCFSWELGSATDTITSSQHIKDPESIGSAGNKFKLGFFSPSNSMNRYVGIWYSRSNSSVITPDIVITPVWVANRNKPINDSSGIMTISEDGNLVVLNGWKEILWSSNVSNGVHNSSVQLMDDGNLVLRGSENGNILWESFQEPSDTYMEKMKLSANARTGKKTLLKSWTNPSDPSIGSFSAGIDPSSIPEFFIWKDSRPFWRSGPWNGQLFIGDPAMPSAYLNGFDLSDDRNGTSSLSFDFGDVCDLAYYFLTSDGNYKYLCWVDGKLDGNKKWQIPENECDVYGKCGAFGSCNAQNSPICSCLGGFEPKNPDEWNRGNWTNGCIRRRSLKCERNLSGGEWRKEDGKEDGFLKLEMMKVPDFAEWSDSSSEQSCTDKCVNNCSCVAYAHSTGIGCMLWTRSLIDVMKLSTGGADLYIRLAHSELEKKKDIKVMIVTVTIGTIIIAICVFFLWRQIAKRRESKETYPILLDENMTQDNINQVKLQELPLLDLQKLIAATDKFDIANKLGQGGFGPVYKGKLKDGQEIAVKRLSRACGQGLEEFMNEVEVISKLQHRNLVRLLGCCVEGEEKMLVYEYMPNNSLDAFLFDPVRKQLLDWRKRFNIVNGICRGLLYLHRDSRLRIIHRDLKPGNILLDQELNPKISDFGMARIFGGNEDQANTRRVVGTYGYMSPEYAMEGLFSEKSDVFSFGVLLLEIISGRKNTSFYGNEQALSLLRFAWKLWNEGNSAALIDPVISNPSFEVEIFRCIHVGLLCVQEFAKDRPTISTVISMLSSEILDLTAPKQPAFTERSYIGRESSQQNQNSDSTNNVTITLVGR